MKALKIFVLHSMAALLTIYYCPSQVNTNDYSKFTDLRIGDTVQLIEPSTDYYAFVYVFADESACFTCMSSLDLFGGHDFFPGSDNKKKFKSMLFLSGVGSDFAERLSAENNWDNFEIILDKVGAYKQFYKVKNNAFYFIADKDGKICAMDKSGGVILTYKDIKNVLDSLSNIEEKKQLKEIKRIKFHDAESNFFIGQRRVVRYSEKAGNFVAFDNKNCSFVVFDSLGSAIRQEVVNINNSRYCLSIWDAQFLNPDTLIFYVMADDVNRFFVWYSLDGNFIKSHEITRIKNLDKRYWSGLSFAINPLNNHFYVDCNQNQSFDNFTHKLDSSFNTIQIFVQDGDFQNFIGVPNNEYYENYNSKSFWGRLAFCNDGKLFESQNLTSTINVYDNKNYFLKKYYLKMGNSWRGSHLSYDNKNRTMEDLAKFRNKTSWVDDLFIDSETETGAMHYVNRTLPQGELSPYGPGVLSERYLHFFYINDGSPVYSDDIKLPDSALPIMIKGNRILVSELKGNALEAVWYEIINN